MGAMSMKFTGTVTVVDQDPPALRTLPDAQRRGRGGRDRLPGALPRSATVTATEPRPVGFGRLTRKEDARFVRGQGTYVDDLQLPRMLHGAMLRSPVAHARI